MLRRGDIVRIEGPDGQTVEEVVRGVDVLVHLANGADTIVALETDVTIVDESTLDEELRAQLESVSHDNNETEGE